MTSSDVPALSEIGVSTEPAARLSAAILAVYPELLKTVRYYVYRAGLARTEDQLLELTTEILDEAVARALARADRWDPSRGTRPWLAAFAANIVRERQRVSAQERLHLLPVPDAARSETDQTYGLPDPATLGTDHLFELLDLIEEPERTLLRLAYVQREPQADLARRLGISDGALRVRLTRAKQRFGQAFEAAERGEKGGPR